MNIHKCARLTPRGREILVRRILHEGLRVAEAAHTSGVSERTAYKWLARYRGEGLEGLCDRSSRPHRCPHRTSEAHAAQVVALRRARRTYRDISHTLGVAPSTIGRIAQRARVNRLSQLEPPPPENRYVLPNPGDLLHLDTKKLGRFRRPGHRVTGDRRQNSPGAGWEVVHVALDDTSRTSFSSIHPDERAESACRALLAALRYFQTLGISFRRVMTDNGSCYTSRRFARLCRRLNLKHTRTRPYSPRTNGKAERFIQTLLREWAYARAYLSSAQRAAHLPPWLHHYNWHRPHASLNYLSPIQSLNLPLNNVVAIHS